MTGAGGTRILVVWDTGCVTQLVHPGEGVVVGRHAECEIHIPLRSVSRRHASLFCEGNGKPVRIEDVGGMNGVRVGGKRIRAGEPTALHAGDVVEIGGAVLVLHPAGEATRSPAVGAGALARAAVYRALGSSPKERSFGAHEVDRLVDVVAQSDLGVLLLGERGVGKSMVAEAVHARSSRANGPFARVDCAAFEGSVLDEELFGTHEGAGALGAARGGTLILDEVAELSLECQARLEAAFRERRADARLVATTRRDLYRQCCAGAFRTDLYYRLTGIRVMLPALRERAAEIPKLAKRFLIEAAARLGRPAPRLSNEALGVLVHNPFHGNLRELTRTMDRAGALAGSGFVGPEHLAFDARASLVPPPPQTSRLVLGGATEPPGGLADAPPTVIPAAPRVPRSPRAPKR